MEKVGSSEETTGESVKEEQKEKSDAVITVANQESPVDGPREILPNKEVVKEKKEPYNEVVKEKKEPYNPDAPVVYGVTVSLMKEFHPETFPSWHNILDEMKRDEIRLLIFELIKQRRQSPSHDWLDNLQEVSRKVEERLYFAASSLEEYSETRTLVKRIESFVKEAAREGRYCSDSDRSGDEAASSEDEVMQIQYRDPMEILKSLPPPPRQVSSQGCSRVFIVKVLASVSEFVNGKLLPSIFTFPRDLVVNWLQKAKEACCSSSLLNEEDYYGGPPFIPDDASTHWTEPHQLYTWWKNNIERKVKYKILQEDAMYCGPEQRRAARARWCAVVLSLAEVIRCSSGLPMQTKSLITAAMNGGNVEAVMKNQPGVTGSPELSHFSHLSGSFSLPSLQYPMNTNLPDVQLQKMNHPTRGEIPKVPVQRYDRGFQYQRLPPKKALDDSVVPPRTLNAPRMLLGNALLNVIPATSNGSFIRPSAEGIPKVTQNQSPHLNPAWKDDTTKEQKKALFKERSDQIKASSMNNSSSQKGYQQAFPLKLYDLVTEQNNDIIGWLPEGNAFKVKHMENFVNIILPAYFKHGNFTSFQRQLNLYGFRRTKESEKGAYYHPNFIFGKRDLAAGIRRLLTSGQSEISAINIERKPSELDLPPPPPLPPPEVPVIPEPPPEPVDLEPIKPEVILAPTRRSGNPKPLKSRTSRSVEKLPKTNPAAKPTKESDLYSINPERKHDYGTRRKRLKKQFDEFITNDEIFKRNRKEDEDEAGESPRNANSSTGSSLPMVYVSGLGSSQDCDEVIDMNSIPNQRRRLVSRRIMIDMTPTLNGRAPIVSESQEVTKRRPTTPKLKDEDASIYNTTLSSVSHSKLTRVGDEFQAMIPPLLASPPPQQSGGGEDHNDFLPVLSAEMNQEFQAAARRREQIFLTFSTSQVIVAVIPNSNSRRVKRSTAPASCILADKSIRSQLLASQFVSPPACVMSPEVKSTLFPRLCVALRRVTLVQSQPTTTGEHPQLFFKPEEQEHEVIKSPLWGCVYLHEDDSSDSELEWGDHHPGVRDMFAMMAERYPGGDDHSTYLEVTDGTQNWIVPLAVCASAGSIDYQEYFLQTHHPHLRAILTDSLKNPSFKFSPMELQKLGWIDASMNIFFHQISPLLKRSHENLSRTWRDLQSAFQGNPWPSSLKEFIFFCLRYCPHPSDSIATCDSRIVAMRRLINMTSDLDTTTYKIEELLQDETDKLLLSRYLRPDVKLAPDIDIESVEDDENEDESISETEETLDSSSPREEPSAASARKKHSLLAVGTGAGEESDQEEEEDMTPPLISGAAVTEMRASRQKS